MTQRAMVEVDREELDLQNEVMTQQIRQIGQLMFEQTTQAVKARRLEARIDELETMLALANDGEKGEDVDQEPVEGPDTKD